jgi:catalase
MPAVSSAKGEQAISTHVHLRSHFSSVGWLLVAAMMLPTSAPAEDGAQLVGDLHSVFGEHHARADHAKGTILEGWFTPSADAGALSKAAVFGKEAAPITVRFSDFTGMPEIADNTRDANPMGFAIKFHVGQGSDLDLVTHSFNGFPTATADELGELLRAMAASGPGAAKPTALDSFLIFHPSARTFLTSQKPPPLSYATVTYYGVNAFAFTNAKGVRVFVRYRMMPQAGEHYLDSADLNTKGPNYLQDEITNRVMSKTIQFDWLAQIAGSGDKIDDPSVAWPDTRKLVRLGTITINQISPDQLSLDKELLFLPGETPDGIEAADPMLAIRDDAYPRSWGERQ